MVEIIPSGYIDRLRRHVDNFMSTAEPGTDLELEVRFGYFTKVFHPDVGHGLFNRLKSQLIEGRAPSSYTHSLDEMIDGYRYTTVYSQDGGPVQRYRMLKTRLEDMDIALYSLRISVSTEKVDDTPRPNGAAEITREKRRWSFPFAKQYRLDMTEVTTGEGAITYEVELEITQPWASGVDGLNRFMGIMLSTYQGTTILYTSDEKERVMGIVNSILGVKSIRGRGVNIRKGLIQPRNLRMSDLQVGHIVPKSSRGVSYTVTPKADGYRRLLFIHSGGIYLVYANEMDKIADAEVAARLNRSWYNTLFECEVIPKQNLSPSAPEKYRRARMYVMMYDTLSLGGQNNVRNMSLFTRLETIQNFIQNVTMGLTTYIFEMKEFLRFDTVDGFFRTSNTILLNEYPFETDGLIYTPDNYKYDADVNKIPLAQRSLNKQPDVMKWKPPHLLTIDMAIHHLPEGRVALLVQEQKRNVEFKVDTVDIDVEVTEGIRNSPSGTIVEFAWRDGRFTPVRIRYDKPAPNTMEVALAVWRDIMSPIDAETIRGLKFSLLFRYHNRLKRELYRATKAASAKSLLDIGSGRGGDVDKWMEAGYTHIICVEPNEAHRTILERRLQGALRRRDFRYIILPLNGEDYNTIIREAHRFMGGRKIDVISYMLSYSFFDQNDPRPIMTLVLNLLNVKGYLLMFTIDGEGVFEYFNQPANFKVINGKLRSNLTMINLTLTPSDTPTLYVNIPNSIVDEQTEYLTDLKYLEESMVGMNIGMNTILKVKESDDVKELFLLPEEEVYNRMFTRMIMRRGG